MYNVFSFCVVTRSIKYKQILSSVIGKIFDQVKIYSLGKFKVYSLHLNIKRLIILIRIKYFVESWLESTNFQPIKKDEIFQIHLDQLRKSKSVLR